MEPAGCVPARRAKPPGRSLEPRSDAEPRGMAVPQHSCCGQNSAYRSGCHRFNSLGTIDRKSCQNLTTVIDHAGHLALNSQSTVKPEHGPTHKLSDEQLCGKKHPAALDK